MEFRKHSPNMFSVPTKRDRAREKESDRNRKRTREKEPSLSLMTQPLCHVFKLCLHYARAYFGGGGRVTKSCGWGVGGRGVTGSGGGLVGRWVKSRGPEQDRL